MEWYKEVKVAWATTDTKVSLYSLDCCDTSECPPVVVGPINEFCLFFLLLSMVLQLALL